METLLAASARESLKQQWVNTLASKFLSERGASGWAEKQNVAHGVAPSSAAVAQHCIRGCKGLGAGGSAAALAHLLYNQAWRHGRWMRKWCRAFRRRWQLRIKPRMSIDPAKVRSKARASEDKFGLVFVAVFLPRLRHF